MSRHDCLWFEARTATRHSSSSPLCYILEHFLLVPYFFLSREEIADSRGGVEMEQGGPMRPCPLPPLVAISRVIKFTSVGGEIHALLSS